jgi:hypothetical protein
MSDAPDPAMPGWPKHEATAVGHGSVLLQHRFAACGMHFIELRVGILALD